jgi:hypothetical protein
MVLESAGIAGRLRSHLLLDILRNVLCSKGQRRVRGAPAHAGYVYNEPTFSIVNRSMACCAG